MANIEEILKTARERARKLGLAYAGALTPREAFDLWQEVRGAQLVDVRTKAEFDWVGRVPGAIEIEFSL
ncbi:MAG: rhodanese-like domain-containing protein, partial [Pseudomonadota bacterium]